MALTIDQKNNIEFILKNLLAGGVAGMCSKTTVAPLDRIKILFQAQSSHYRNHSVFAGLTAIVNRESLLALYKGNGAQMVRIFPYAATQFTSFEIYKKQTTVSLSYKRTTITNYYTAIRRRFGHNVKCRNHRIRRRFSIGAPAQAASVDPLTAYCRPRIRFHRSRIAVIGVHFPIRAVPTA
ncbi:Graves disease carrier protein [Eumeta japonica]|uniref:Graves disease carrier protein n=1 Tax=Eumeta variegata TaxID=151549 RepID=A0A4C1UUK8_EUMVA|nr:Graves disease carrier protein [Eumeta japonica]